MGEARATDRPKVIVISGPKLIAEGGINFEERIFDARSWNEAKDQADNGNG